MDLKTISHPTLQQQEEISSVSPIERCEKISEAYCGIATQRHAQSVEFLFNVQNSQRIVPCSDGKNYPYQQRLNQMDVNSILRFDYHAGEIAIPERRKNFDPGRFRLDLLLASVYGGTSEEVKNNLVDVPFLGETVQFNKRNGAASALAQVGKELATLRESDPIIKKFFSEGRITKEVWKWRTIAGTDRRSSHSYGTALDLANGLSKGQEYWFWEAQKVYGKEYIEDDRPVPLTQMARVPWPIVEVFEKHGFIWGGKWNHFDSMHFEYRPEFFPSIQKECARRP